jgi:hypothetical protein
LSIYIGGSLTIGAFFNRRAELGANVVGQTGGESDETVVAIASRSLKP